MQGLLFHNLLFADDFHLFTQENISQAAKLEEIFTIYENCFGQTINYDKFYLYLAKELLLSYGRILALYSNL